MKGKELQVLDSLIERNNYRVIIIEPDLIMNHRYLNHTRRNSATNHASLENLLAVSEQIQVKKRSGEQINIASFARRFHHLNDDWLDGIQVRGRFPRWKIQRWRTNCNVGTGKRQFFNRQSLCVPNHSTDSLKEFI